MKGSNSVCLLCRLQVAKATSKARAVQWQTQAARISTTSSRHDATGTGGATTDDGAVPELAPGTSQSPPHVRKILFNVLGPKPKAQAPPITATPEQPHSRVDALFQQILREQRDLHHVDTSSTAREGASTDLSLVRAIGQLQEMVEGNAPMADAYLFFRTKVKPAIQMPGIHMPQAYHTVKLMLLEKLVVAKTADIFAEDLPTVADIFRIFAEDGELKPKQWAVLVGQLVQCIAEIDLSVEMQSVAKYERQLGLREAMLADLVESWKVLSLPRPAISQTSENELTNGFWFPRLDKFFLSKFAKKGKFTEAFSTLFPQYPPSQLGSPIAVLAIATYVLLHDSQRCSVNVRQNATRFMSKVAYLVTFVNYQDKTLQAELAATFPKLAPYIMELWPKIRPFLGKNHAFEGERSTEVRNLFASASKNKSNRVFDAAFIGHHLSRFHGAGNSAMLDSLWEEFVGSEKTISEERAAQIRQNPHLIDSFIKTRMTINQPDKAIAAWNILGKVGLRPSLRTWNLMLDGLRKAGNVEGIRNIWAKLAKSGLKLDTAIWTTRIAGLIDCGDIEGGLHALEEMAKLSEKDTKNTAVTLTVEPINAALGGLIRWKQHEAAEKLLAWADRKGIQPDIFTFNTMLRSLIRDESRGKDVEKLFATMQAQGVHADEATFTIVLDASFSKDDIRDPEEQTNIVAEVASTMAAAGLELNMQTYGKMIYLLLRSNARTPAMAVVNHLYNRNMELSPHIYTMLVENCFAQNPPALDSVHLFVQRRRHLDFDDMDHIFYDRVIRGYTLLGETQAALDVYKHVAERGGKVALGLLDGLLRDLLRQDRREDARDMVNREKKRFEGQHADAKDHVPYWSNQFWQLASRYDLLDSPLPSLARPGARAEGGDSTGVRDSVTPP